MEYSPHTVVSTELEELIITRLSLMVYVCKLTHSFLFFSTFFLLKI